jgi:hypothetical protein
MGAALSIFRRKWKCSAGLFGLLDDRRIAGLLASGGTMVKSSKMANT